MPLSCSSALICCMDFRLTSALHAWMEKEGIMDDCDVISVAGISKAIAEDKESNDAKFILKQIEPSSKLHDIKTLYLIHHTDCGAYGGHNAFQSIDTEKQTYIHDMEKVKKVIHDSFSGLKIRCILAEMHSPENIQFVSLN